MWHHDLSALSALSEPVRERLYTFIRAAAHPMSREEAATGAGISPKLAAFHLEKLVAVGLLEVSPRTEHRRRSRGRAPKLYSITKREFSVAIPARRYELLGEILIEALSVDDDDRSARKALDAASRAGRAAGERIRHERNLGRVGPERALGAAAEFLAEAGFEPYRSGPQTLQLRNCPFRGLARRWPELVCEINHAYLESLVRGVGSERVKALRQPPNGMCCVALQAS